MAGVIRTVLSTASGVTRRAVAPRVPVFAARAFSAGWADIPQAPNDAIFGLTLAYNAVRAVTG